MSGSLKWYEARYRARIALRVIVLAAVLVGGVQVARGLTAFDPAALVQAIRSRKPAPPPTVAEPAAKPKVVASRPPRASRRAQPTEDGALPLVFDAAAKDHLPPPSLAAGERNCLARAVYYEARGEPIEGQIAVAQIVLNRARSPRWPSSVCGVVYQGVDRGEKCQFSFACHDRNRSPEGDPMWTQTQWVADEVAADRAALSELVDSTYYHTVKVRPVWRLGLREVARIGTHVFYADPATTRDLGERLASLNGSEPLADLLPQPVEAIRHSPAGPKSLAAAPPPAAADTARPARPPVARGPARAAQAQVPASATNVWQQMQQR